MILLIASQTVYSQRIQTSPYAEAQIHAENSLKDHQCFFYKIDPSKSVYNSVKANPELKKYLNIKII